MPIYDRRDPDDPRVIDRWDSCLGWLAHPGEDGRRASHAVVGDDGGVWLLDPLDAPGVDGLVADLGSVAGVAVCSNWHARDADALARRYGVPVSVPRWMDRVEDRTEAPVERYEGTLGSSGLAVLRCEPLPGWQEAVLYREVDGTLYVPDSLHGVRERFVGDERVGISAVRRLSPPRDLLGNLDPDRVLFGHGCGITDDAGGALTDTLASARRRLPRAVIDNPRLEVGSLVSALRSR